MSHVFECIQNKNRALLFKALLYMAACAVSFEAYHLSLRRDSEDVALQQYALSGAFKQMK